MFSNRLICSLVFICLIFIRIHTSGQTSVYHPFPDSNAIWNIHAQFADPNSNPGCNGPGNLLFNDSYYSYFIKGDTTIFNQQYHNVYLSGLLNTHCYFGTAIDYWTVIPEEFYCSFRQDISSKRVFKFDPITNQDYLVYDFSLSSGDTLPTPDGAGCRMEITSIDSILIGLEYRKRYNFNSQYTIIEGIGSTAGFFETICPFEYYPGLTCFGENGITLYPDSSFQCFIINQVEEISRNEFSISPNPTNGKLLIQTVTNSNEFSIYDLTGKLMDKFLITDVESILDISAYPNGIYFIKNSEGHFRKIVKHN